MFSVLTLCVYELVEGIRRRISDWKGMEEDESVAGEFELQLAVTTDAG